VGYWLVMGGSTLVKEKQWSTSIIEYYCKYRTLSIIATRVLFDLVVGPFASEACHESNAYKRVSLSSLVNLSSLLLIVHLLYMDE